MTILEEAAALTSGDRHESYGSWGEEAMRVARGWSELTGKDILPEHVAPMMIWLKLVRETHRSKRDNLVDICGYAALQDAFFGDPA